MELTSKDIENIRALSTKFRDVLSSTKIHYPTLENFPKGSCGDASLLLANYLKNNGYPNSVYICGVDNTGKGPSHAWLELGNVIVDITFHQFDPSITEPIFPLNSELHSRFEEDIRHAADITIYDPYTVVTLTGLYQSIIKEGNL